ncbi:MAG: acyl-CoA thioesterase [Bacteroidetes bacterium]|nr:acyl-CoA thioesterase [Bacteroidota bacterium]MCY4233512.1 acyl-CoA thioesterase [Bacteroidota bacterium]
MGAQKTPHDSRSVMSEVTLPNDTNPYGTMFGGRLMSLMDKCAAISAMRHTELVCVTVAIDSVEFASPIYLGELVVIEAWVNRVFNSSLEVEVMVEAENIFKKKRRLCNHAFFTFVAVNDQGEPTAVEPVYPQTDLEKQRYEKAALRRELRLYMKGRISLEEAVHLQDDLIAEISKTDLQ